MAYPARLEVTTLLDSGDGEDLSNPIVPPTPPYPLASNPPAPPYPLSSNPPASPYPLATNPPASHHTSYPLTTDQPCPTPPSSRPKTSRESKGVFVIAEAAKRPKSAVVMGSSRITPLPNVNSLHPAPTPSTTPPRPRSSPRIPRRCIRVTPLPTCTCPPAPNTIAGNPLTSTPRAKGDHDKEWCQAKAPPMALLGGRHSPSPNNMEDPDAPWPSSSLDSGPIEHLTPIQTSPKESKSPWQGMYTVPTINVDNPAGDRRRRRYGHSSNNDNNNYSSLEHSRYVTERIHHLVTAFSQRASRVKAQITQPPTPSTELSEGGEDPNKPQDIRQRLDSLMPELSSRSPSPGRLVGVRSRRAWLVRRLRGCRKAVDFPAAMEPQSRLYIWWLLVVSIAYVYNAWVIPLRFVFSEYQTDTNLPYWLVADYLADLVYIADILVFQSRVKYLDNGFWVSTPSLMRKHYVKSTKFRYDLASLLPLDLLYFKFGPLSIFRLPRLIKIQTFWEFYNRLDSVLSSPHAVRVVRTVLYMLYLIHLNTCAYYGFSKIEGIGSNRWVFQGKGNAYIRCFYFATKTATSIGKNPKPENEAEYLFMTASWLMGVFVFALLIGQIRDIVATATRNQNEYRKVMDQTHVYLHRLNLPKALQDRVRTWFTYTWQHQKTLDEMKCLQSLPRKMRTDIAISVHIQTLSKVQLFQDCDKALLRDLVLKLKPVLYLPGDFVCKKGEVGKEMYIVQTGQVLVMGGEQGDVVLASLGEGSVFGEISLLALAGGNRRTANVRSRGFSSLFVLSKVDLQATIKDYPEAQEILKKKAKRLIRQNQAREKQEPRPDENVIIKSRESTPKLLHAVLQVVRPDSFTASVIRRSSRSVSRSTLDIPSMESWPWAPSPNRLMSSASLEVPVRRSRRSARESLRSSLEVPSSSHRYYSSGPPRTSMSESLPEEEEEFIVVETLSEDGGEARPPGSPVSCSSSRHSISIHRSSRPGTPQSPYPDYSPVTSPRAQHNQKRCEADEGVCSRYDTASFHGSDEQNSVSSTCRYSPASLVRQSALSFSPSLEPPSLEAAGLLHTGDDQLPPLSAPPYLSLEPQLPESQQSTAPLHFTYNHIQRSPSPKPSSAKSYSECRRPSMGNIAKPSSAPPSGRARNNSVRNDHTRVQKLVPLGSRGSSNYQANGKSENLADATAETAKGNNKKGGRGVARDSEGRPRRASNHSLKNGGVVAVDKSKRPSEGREGTKVSRANKTSKGEAKGKGGKGEGGKGKGGRSSKAKHANISNKNILHLDPEAKHCSADSAIQMSAFDALDRNSFPDGPSYSHLSSGTVQTNGEVETMVTEHRGNGLVDFGDEKRGLFNTDLNTSPVTGHKHMFGLSTSSVESGIIPDTPHSCIASFDSPPSYDLFLSELSKTLPAMSQALPARTPDLSYRYRSPIQVPTSSPHLFSSSPLPLSSSSSPNPQAPSPLPLFSSRISCSAIVHREGTPSPDTLASPFDAQESRL